MIAYGMGFKVKGAAKRKIFIKYRYFPCFIAVYAININF